jgi:hypothetical protein
LGGQFFPVPDCIKRDVADCAACEPEVFAGGGSIVDETADRGEWVGDGFAGFFTCFFVVGDCSAVFDLDGCGGVEAYEAVLGEFSGAFDGFEKVSGGVFLVEF